MESVEKKSLLYRSKVEYADYCLNHVMGCAHGCKFPCYAFNIAKRFGRLKTYSEWINPILVSNSLELLDKELPKMHKDINFVHMCFTTDPFMYKYSEVSDLSLKIIEKLNKWNVKCTTLTKGIYPKELVDMEKYGASNEYGITLVSLNNDFKRDYEPYSAPYNERVDALRYLHDNGLKTWVSIEPYPTPNIDENQDLGTLLNSVDFVDRIIFGKLNYNVKSNHFLKNYDFYEECANIVISYCEKNNISYHIKFGTRKLYDKNTEKLFVEGSI